MGFFSKFRGWLARRQLERKARRISEPDIEDILKQSDDIRKRFETGGPLGRFVEDAKLIIAIMGDYKNGRYRAIPFWAIAAMAAGLIYVVNPLDIIPDPVPLVGQLDDATVLAACLAMVEQELHTYKEWKIHNSD